MFVVNGKMLSLKEQPELFNWYKKLADEIKESENEYFVFSSTKVATYEEDDHGRKRKVKKFKSIPPTSTFYNEKFNESQTWNYVASANSVRNENGMLTIVNQNPFVIGPRYVLHKVSDVEIIFFLLHISEALKNRHIFEIDKRKESIEKAAKSRIAAEAQYLLYHESSPVSPESTGSEDAIRQIAMSFGVLGIKEKRIDEVRNNLWDKVLDKENTRERGKFGFEGLIKAFNKIKFSAKRAVVLTAVELGFLYYENFQWFIQIKGSATRELCNVPPNDEKQKNEYLIDYIFGNPEYFDLIKAAVQKPEENKVRENTDSLEREELIEEAARLGWDKQKLYRKKTVDLAEIVKNTIQPVENE